MWFIYPTLPDHIQSLFPNTFQPSELGPIPEGWNTGTIAEIAQQVRENVRPDQFRADDAYIALEHMPRQSISLSDWTDIEGIGSNKSRFQLGDILFGKLRPYFHKVGVAPINGICSTDIVVSRPLEDSNFGFLLGHLSSIDFVSYTSAGSSGTKMPRTNWKDMSRYEIVVPDEATQGKFDEFAREYVAQMHHNIFESITLSKLRDTLLPKLISGELRVPDAEKFVEDVV